MTFGWEFLTVTDRLSPSMPPPPVLMLAALLFASAPLAHSLELWRNPSTKRALNLDTSLKWTATTSLSPADDILYPDRTSSLGAFRLRLGLGAKLTDWIDAEVAYEQRMQVASSNSLPALARNGLPATDQEYYRTTPLDWVISENDEDFRHQHGIDRALIVLHPKWGEITLGRQAIGLGRGVIFNAIDLFSPFTPSEIDREWRRGVDAGRFEVRLTDTVSMELLTVLDRNWESSCLLGRLRGYIGRFDGELVFGKRGMDRMAGLALSSTVGDAEIHGEMALFSLERTWKPGALGGNDNTVAKGVIGGSYTFAIGSGLTVLTEYLYNGFGVQETDEPMTFSETMALQRSLGLQDAQTLGQHTLGVEMSYPATDTLTVGALALQNMVDGSGLFSPRITWDMSESAALVGSAFFPWGRDPAGGQIQSEYGASPVSVFLQLSMHF